MFAISLVAVGAAIAAWLRPVPIHHISDSSGRRRIASKQGALTPTIKGVRCDRKSEEAKYHEVQTRNGGENGILNGQILIAVNGRQVYIAIQSIRFGDIDRRASNSG